MPEETAAPATPPTAATIAARLADLLPGPLPGWLPARVLDDWRRLAALEDGLAGLNSPDDAERRAERIATLPAALAALAADDWWRPLPAGPVADVATLLAEAQRAWRPYALAALAACGGGDERDHGYAVALGGGFFLLARLAGLDAECRAGTPWLATDELAKYRTRVAALAGGLVHPGLVAANLDRTRRLLRAGSPLGRRLRGRHGLLLRVALLAADRRIAALRAAGPDVPPDARTTLTLLALGIWHGLRPERRTRT